MLISNLTMDLQLLNPKKILASASMYHHTKFQVITSCPLRENEEISQEKKEKKVSYWTP